MSPHPDPSRGETGMRGMSSAEIREQLVRALELDVVGPAKGHLLEGEVLSQAPSRWYLTGFLVPFQARPEEKEDPAAGEQEEAEGWRVAGMCYL